MGASRGRSRCNEEVDGDRGNFGDGWRDNKGSLGLPGASGELCSGDWRWTFLVLCRVGEMTSSAVEAEEEPGIADCDFGDGRAWDDVCNAGDDKDSRPRPKVTFRKMLIFPLCGSMFLGLSFSFPLVVPANAASSSTMSGVGGSFFDRVAVRKLCSSVDRNF